MFKLKHLSKLPVPFVAIATISFFFVDWRHDASIEYVVLALVVTVLVTIISGFRVADFSEKTQPWLAVVLVVALVGLFLLNASTFNVHLVDARWEIDKRRDGEFRTLFYKHPNKHIETGAWPFFCIRQFVEGRRFVLGSKVINRSTFVKAIANPSELKIEASIPDSDLQRARRYFDRSLQSGILQSSKCGEYTVYWGADVREYRLYLDGEELLVAPSVEL